jgi:hypothetical protein
MHVKCCPLFLSLTLNLAYLSGLHSDPAQILGPTGNPADILSGERQGERGGDAHECT